MKKKLTFFTIILLIAVAFSAAAKPKYLFKIATEVPQGSLWYNVLLDIRKELYVKTNKEVGLQFYAGGVMGDQATVIKKIKLGQLSGSTFSNTGLQIIYHDFGIAGFPMMIRNEREYDYFKKELAPFFEQKLANNGFVVLAWSETGPIYVYSKKPVNSAATLKTAKAFVLEGDRISMAMFDEFGSTPIPLQTSDILTSLQTGQIDTVFSPPYGLMAMQWFSKVNYMADFPITYMLGSFAVDKKMFDSMPPEYRKLMKDIFKKHFDRLTPKIRKDNDTARETLLNHGIKLLTVDEAQKKIFYDTCNRAHGTLLKKEGYSKEIYDKVKRTMDNFRK